MVVVVVAGAGGSALAGGGVATGVGPVSIAAGARNVCGISWPV
nr:hypothetical protein [uncultured Devosia sp.]